MNLDLDEPIFALASPPGSSARNIVRISGGQVQELLQPWFTPENLAAWSESRSAARHRGKIVLPQCRVGMDVEVYLWPNGKSYTGQQLIELHLPGSPPLVEATLVQISRSSVRRARPGEFTLRAFLAGKIDLLQAEAVLGVIDASDGAELKSALDQLAGGISTPLSALREDILELLADIEAGLDFIEEDIEFVSRAELGARISSAHQFLKRLLDQAESRTQSRVRPQIVLAGLPNAGKSTLFNKIVAESLASRDSDAVAPPVAMMSPVEGTTRDYLCAQVCLLGIEVNLVDTAGWDLNAIEIENVAQRQLADQIQRADLLVWCSSAVMTREKRNLDESLFSQATLSARNVIRIQTQSDLFPASIQSQVQNEVREPQPRPLSLSAVTGEGIRDLTRHIAEMFLAKQSLSRDWLGTTVSRCHDSLVAAGESLGRAEISASASRTGDELLAIDLREALDHLGLVIGSVYSDDILDRVFSKFCIGK